MRTESEGNFVARNGIYRNVFLFILFIPSFLTELSMFLNQLSCEISLLMNYENLYLKRLQ